MTKQGTSHFFTSLHSPIYLSLPAFASGRTNAQKPMKEVASLTSQLQRKSTSPTSCVNVNLDGVFFRQDIRRSEESIRTVSCTKFAVCYNYHIHNTACVSVNLESFRQDIRRSPSGQLRVPSSQCVYQVRTFTRPVSMSIRVFFRVNDQESIRTVLCTRFAVCVPSSQSHGPSRCCVCIQDYRSGVHPDSIVYQVRSVCKYQVRSVCAKFAHSHCNCTSTRCCSTTSNMHASNHTVRRANTHATNKYAS